MKEISTFISMPLSHILNLSFTCGIFSQTLKQAVVGPIHKGSSMSDVANFRPIYVIVSVSKVIERAVCILG